MRVEAIKTSKVMPGDDLFTILDKYITDLSENSVVAVTSKIVSLAENSVVPMDSISKQELVAREASLYLSKQASKYGHSFTITNKTLISSAGIDMSNGDGYYVLWPKDAQQSANSIRKHLREKFGLNNIGVVITDSTCQPMRRGTSGIYLSFSGFQALNNYIGKPDLFGKPFDVSQAGVASGLAAAAVLAMGEGSEQTPLAIISDLPMVKFEQNDPSPEELEENIISKEDDLFAPFLEAVNWQKGKDGQAD